MVLLNHKKAFLTKNASQSRRALRGGGTLSIEQQGSNTPETPLSVEVG